MREFGFSFEELLALPIKRFWFLINQIERILAQRDMAQLQVIAGAAGQDGYEAVSTYLKNQVGDIYVWVPVASGKYQVDPETGLDPEFDRDALMAMKQRLANERA